MKFTTRLILFIGLLIFGLNISAQCLTWNEQPNKDELEGDHSVYRQALKNDDFKTAIVAWEKVYKAAPAADGNRDFHYMDGIKINKYLLGQATDEAKKTEIKATILRLYDEAISCYESRGISMKCGTDDCYNAKLGFLHGRKGYDMYYELNSPYSKNLVAFEKAVSLGGNETEYIVMVPYASIVVYQFEKELMDKAQARSVHTALNEIADFNIANNEKYSAYYQQAKDAMNATFAKIERDIFDCEYFKNKLRPEYTADPENPDVIKKILGILKGQGCTPGDPFYDELDNKWKKYASAENAKIQAEFEANNPSMMAKKLYDEGNYDGAVQKYSEAIDGEIDNEKKASYLFSKASILFRKLNRYSEARSTAYEAAKLKPNWGRPYTLIGDMYGTSARSCGDSWNQRLAIIAAIDKYNYAKSIDPEEADEASRRINQYSRSLPDQSEGFMKGIKAGDSANVGCWIGESVRVRYK